MEKANDQDLNNNQNQPEATVPVEGRIQHIDSNAYKEVSSNDEVGDLSNLDYVNENDGEKLKLDYIYIN